MARLRDFFKRPKPIVDVLSRPEIARKIAASPRARATLPQAQRLIRDARTARRQTTPFRAIKQELIDVPVRQGRQKRQKRVKELTAKGIPLQRAQGTVFGERVIDFAPIGAISSKFAGPARKLPKFISRGIKRLTSRKPLDNLFQELDAVEQVIRKTSRTIKDDLVATRARNAVEALRKNPTPENIRKANEALKFGNIRAQKLAKPEFAIKKLPDITDPQAGAIVPGEILEAAKRPFRRLLKRQDVSSVKLISKGLQTARDTAAGKLTRRLPQLVAERRATFEALGTPLAKDGRAKVSISKKIAASTGARLRDSKSLDNVIGDVSAKEKINIIDLFRTPTKILNKIGLGKEGKALEQSWDAYKSELPSHIDKIGEWLKRLGGKNASVRVFRNLDGQKVRLTKVEQDVANEINEYLKVWANRLDLPEDKRIASYITHLFDDSFKGKEFDPEIARLITDKVAGSVYDPFLQKRLGARGYKEDLGLALQAYAKRGVRKANMDPALAILKKSSKKLEQSQLKYVERLSSRINMRPTEIDSWIDNSARSLGVKSQRPTMRASQFVRMLGFRGALGANVGSAVRNLTQVNNTFAKLGTRYTTRGYIDIVRKMAARDTDELVRAGVLDDQFVDQSISALKKRLETVDKGLFFLFDRAEKINRGSAYYGGKAKALAAGKTEVEAIREGIDLARTTQFKFGAVDTPPILQSDIAKAFLQFQSFNIKQLEFLGDMVANKEWAGLMRYTLGAAIITTTIGKLIGIKPADWVPYADDILEGRTRIGKTPAINLVTSSFKAATGAPDRFGQPTGIGAVGEALIPIIPGGVQARKTIQGLGAVGRGASVSKTGRVRFPVPQNVPELLRKAVFGQFSGEEARLYFDEDMRPLGDKDTSEFDKQVKRGKDPVKVWKSLIKKRIERTHKEKEAKIRNFPGLTQKEKQELMRRLKKSSLRKWEAIKNL